MGFNWSNLVFNSLGFWIQQPLCSGCSTVSSINCGIYFLMSFKHFFSLLISFMYPSWSPVPHKLISSNSELFPNNPAYYDHIFSFLNGSLKFSNLSFNFKLVRLGTILVTTLCTIFVVFSVQHSFSIELHKLFHEPGSNCPFSYRIKAPTFLYRVGLSTMFIDFDYMHNFAN